MFYLLIYLFFSLWFCNAARVCVLSSVEYFNGGQCCTEWCMAVCECAFSPHSHNTHAYTSLAARLCNSFNSYANVFYMESSGFFFLVRIIRTAHKMSANAMETRQEKWRKTEREDNWSCHQNGISTTSRMIFGQFQLWSLYKRFVH